VVTPRRGIGKLGCLVVILVLVTVGYFAVNIGEVFLRYYRFTDAMKQDARFARSLSDDAIRRHLAALADSLGLPDVAGRVLVRRSANRIVLSSDWSEHVELPLFVREFHFSPRVVSGL
jgi:hypothetical protein